MASFPSSLSVSLRIVSCGLEGNCVDCISCDGNLLLLRLRWRPKQSLESVQFQFNPFRSARWQCNEANIETNIIVIVIGFVFPYAKESFLSLCANDCRKRH